MGFKINLTPSPNLNIHTFMRCTTVGNAVLLNVDFRRTWATFDASLSQNVLPGNIGCVFVPANEMKGEGSVFQLKLELCSLNFVHNIEHNEKKALFN